MMKQQLYLPVEQQFQRNAEIYGENIALMKGDNLHGYRAYNYQELNNKANKYARYLQSALVKPGNPVVVFMTDPLEVIPAMIGLFAMGAIFIPLNPSDPPRRIGDVLREIRPDCILVDEENYARLVSIAHSAPRVTIHINKASFREFSDKAQQHDEAQAKTTVGLDDICYVYYSSGTTGKPKGITGTRRGISHFIRWEIETLALGTDVRVSQWTQPFYDAFLRDVFMPLCCGGTIVAPQSNKTVITTMELISWINNSSVSVVHTIPTIFHRVLKENISSTDFQKLKYVLLAGERLMPNDVKRWLEIFGDRIQLVNLYGPSETVMTKLFYFIKSGDESKRSIPIGRPMSEVEVLLVDNHGSPVKQGDIGEIAISPDFDMPGYFQEPELTHSVFVSSPHAKQGIIFKTGDYGRLLDSGDLEFLGRKDHQVKINGIRVELTEVENHIGAHPKVLECVVQLLPENGQHKLVVWLSANLSADTIDKVMYEYLRETLPPYMLPNHYVLLEKLPRLPNGKINYKALPKFLIRAPRKKSQSFFEEVFEQAYELTEIKLTGIWEMALNQTDVRLNDNFFQLGGDSLMVLTVLAEIRKQLNCDVPLATFLNNPTIAQLAKIVSGESESVSSVVVPLNTQGDATPFWCIHPPGGNVLAYAKLAYLIGIKHPFYAIQHPYLIGKDSKVTLEALASDYVSQMLCVQPHGPYIVSGWSMGGIIAFEIASQLLELGHRVSLLVLIDSEWPYLPNITSANNPEHTRQVQWHAFSSLLKYLGEGFNIKPIERKLVFSERVLRGLLNLLAKQFMGMTWSQAEKMQFPRNSLLTMDQLLEKLAGHNYLFSLIPYGLFSKFTPQQQMNLILSILQWTNKTPKNFNADNFNAFMAAFRWHLQAVCAYRPQTIDAKLVLLATGAISAENLAGWSSCSSVEVQAISTPGNHFTLLTEPNVGELAKSIMEVIPKN